MLECSWMYLSTFSLSTSSNRIGKFLNPRDSWGQVNWPLNPGSVHSKANRGWLISAWGREKKAHFRSRRPYKVLPGSNRLSKVLEFGIVGWIISTLLLTPLKSWVGWQSLVPDLMTGNSGVNVSRWLAGDQNSCISKTANVLSNACLSFSRDWIPHYPYKWGWAWELYNWQLMWSQSRGIGLCPHSREL